MTYWSVRYALQASASSEKTSIAAGSCSRRLLATLATQHGHAKIPLVTICEVLRNNFLDTMGISACPLAADTCMTQTCVKEILDGSRSVTADAALGLGRSFAVNTPFAYRVRIARGSHPVCPAMRICVAIPHRRPREQSGLRGKLCGMRDTLEPEPADTGVGKRRR